MKLKEIFTNIPECDFTTRLNEILDFPDLKNITFKGRTCWIKAKTVDGKFTYDVCVITLRKNIPGDIIGLSVFNTKYHQRKYLFVVNCVQILNGCLSFLTDDIEDVPDTLKEFITPFCTKCDQNVRMNARPTKKLDCCGYLCEYHLNSHDCVSME